MNNNLLVTILVRVLNRNRISLKIISLLKFVFCDLDIDVSCVYLPLGV